MKHKQYIFTAILTAITLWWLYTVANMFAANVFFAGANKDMNKGFLSQSLQGYTRAIQLNNKEADYYRRLGESLSLSKYETNTKAAQQVALKAMELNGNHYIVLMAAARIYVNTENYKEAIEVYKTIHNLTPTDPKPLYLMANIHLKTGDTQKAKDALQKAINLKSNYHQAQTLLNSL